MHRYLLGYRANVAIVLFGAFAVMALIKLTAYLPGKYYFSFSKIFAGASEPFIVDPPSVTGARLCALMSRHNLSAADIGRDVNCAAKIEPPNAGGLYGPALFEKDQIDRIYATALMADPGFRAGLAGSGSQLKPQPVPDAELSEILAQAGSISEAYRSIWQKYEETFSSRVSALLKPAVETSFAAVRTRESERPAVEESSHSGPRLKGLTPAEMDAVRRAHAAFLSAVAAENLGEAAKPITKSRIDSIIETAYGKESIPSGVTSHYSTNVADHAKAILRAKFVEAGITPVEPEAAKRIIFQELVKDGLNNYIVATLLRLLPVLLVGMALGFIFGRGELFSAAFAGAMAAFLLTWPVMLMWDRVVQSTWHDKKLVFLAFYVVYIISFFITARAGALIGIRMREGAPRHITGMIDRETGAVAVQGASWSELVGNIAMGVLANGVVAAWNVVIPLNAS